MSLPTDSAERKHIPMYSGLIAYFPDALAAVAAHTWESNEKHNPGEPMHWAREKSNDHMDCIIRHMTDIATGDDKIYALKCIIWRSCAELQLTLEAQQQAQKEFNEEKARMIRPAAVPAHRLDRIENVDAECLWRCTCGRAFQTWTDFMHHSGRQAQAPDRDRFR